MSDLFTRSRTVILRNFREIEPKLAVGLLTGSVTGFALDFAAQNNVHISPTWQHFIVVAGFFVGGWIKSSSFPTIQEIEAGLPAAETVANKVIHPPLPNTNTQPVKIVPVAAKMSLSDLTAATAVAPTTPPTPVNQEASRQLSAYLDSTQTNDDKETQVLPNTPGASFLNSRGI